MGRVKNMDVSTFVPAPQPAPTEFCGPPRPLRKLSAEEEKKVAYTRSRVKLHMPELVPEIEKLYAAGLIPGWRAVSNFKFVEAT